MRAFVIALLCVGLASCKGPGEKGNAAQGTRISAHMDVATNHADTWTELKAAFEEAGYTLEVTRFTPARLPSEFVLTDKDGMQAHVRLDPQELSPQEASGDMKVVQLLKRLRERDEKPPP